MLGGEQWSENAEPRKDGLEAKERRGIFLVVLTRIFRLFSHYPCCGVSLDFTAL